MEIGRLTVDLIKEIYEKIRKDKNSDALCDFFLFLPIDLIKVFYMKYIKKENCNRFYTLDGYSFCEKSGHFLSFPKAIVKNFFCKDGEPNENKLNLGILADYIGCTKK